MGRSKKNSIYPSKVGTYDVDTTYRRQRIRRCGFESYREAEDFLVSQKQLIKAETTVGQRRPVTLDEAAAKYISEQAANGKVSWANEASMLKPLMATHSSLTIDQIDNDSLADFVAARKAAGRKAKTINITLGAVRSICNRAATAWKFENGLTWLDRAPEITLLDDSDKRPPRPLAWGEQERLLPSLPQHLRQMVLFDLNTGVREDVVCSLRWAWEVRVKIRADVTVTVFVVPRTHVKGRRRERIIICNSVAQRIVDQQRGLNPEFVFCWPKPIGKKEVEYLAVQHINNNGWQKARGRVGLADLRVHDLRHTVGMRLRAAGVSKRTQDAILWHESGEMTDHYAIAQLREVYDALELITKPQEDFETMDLHALIRQTQMQRFTEILPRKEKRAYA
ncbi:tyrosine-type recombinase/integrase [Allopusillimonas ginsengisoli]|uniref:tyrosine-type recombinase/integrase n=1 Tax=Allopusillimonas ginsengisoli TaxID=453575 RepID=UPI001021E890|nr:tyrosine-type recombinase/integrase [Allopusillimonas ginsengisoli]TEA79798.1 site-specific integrase [Allopusillimonas ginsengisoli]